MHTWVNREADLRNQDIAVGRNYGHAIEPNDILSLDKLAFSDRVHVVNTTSRSIELILMDLRSDVLSFVQVVQYLFHLVN
jgi:hypothetical protein